MVPTALILQHQHSLEYHHNLLLNTVVVKQDIHTIRVRSATYALNVTVSKEEQPEKVPSPMNATELIL